MRVGGSLCVALPFEWVRRLKATAGISHRVIRLDWSPDSPSMTVSALTIEELKGELLLAEQASQPFTDGGSVGGSDSVQIAGNGQPSAR